MAQFRSVAGLERLMTAEREDRFTACVGTLSAALPLALVGLQSARLAERRDAVVIDEAAGRPYVENRYQQEWRKVADAAGVPRGVFNMDARLSGATEADEAGAARSDLQRGMGHSDQKTTTRYMRGKPDHPLAESSRHGTGCTSGRK